jgi:hypothetical protein
MVGHTHEAVDRFFSFINRALTNAGNTFTVDEMNTLIHNYLKDGTTMEVVDLEFVADWKKWIAGCSADLHDHTGKGSAHHWKMERDVAGGPVLLRSKHFSSDEQWGPRDGLQMVASVPCGEVEAAEYLQLGGEDSATYMKRLTKTFKHLEENFTLSPMQRQWWQEFLETEAKGEIPAQFTNASKFKMKFPERNDVQQNAVQQSAVQQQSAPGGAGLQSPLSAASFVNAERLNELAVDSFVLVKNQNRTEPLLFGRVSSIDVQKSTFSMQYYSRADNSGTDIDGSFSPMFFRDPGQKKAKKWMIDASMGSLMVFDIVTKRPTKKTGVLKLSKSAKVEVSASIQQHQSLGLLGSAEDNDHSADKDI